MRIIVQFAAIVLFVVLTVAGCDTSTKKVADARENLRDSKEDMAEADYELLVAKQDSTAEYKKFRRESEDRIVALEKQIGELKLKISKERRTNSTESQRILNDLELRTAKMKVELKEFNSDKNEDWKTFKDDFNKNMDELGTAISNFF